MARVKMCLRSRDSAAFSLQVRWSGSGLGAQSNVAAGVPDGARLSCHLYPMPSFEKRLRIIDPNLFPAAVYSGGHQNVRGHREHKVGSGRAHSGREHRGAFDHRGVRRKYDERRV